MKWKLIKTMTIVMSLAMRAEVEEEESNVRMSDKVRLADIERIYKKPKNAYDAAKVFGGRSSKLHQIQEVSIKN